MLLYKLRHNKGEGHYKKLSLNLSPPIATCSKDWGFPLTEPSASKVPAILS